MRLSSTTRLLSNMCKPFTNEIELMKKYGFDGIDFDLNFSISAVLGENWEVKVREFSKMAAEENMPVVQTHLPCRIKMPDGKYKGPADYDSIRQAIVATEILGAKYAVFHAINPAPPNDGLQMTLDYYGPMVEFAEKHNVKMLVEMMPSFCYFPITIEELIDTADGLGIGICWDFGHPNVNTFGKDNDQSDILKIAGNRVKALHVHDNCGGRPDEHLAPYRGSIDWDGIIPVLKEIGYKGDFNFEVLPGAVPGYATHYLAQYLVEIGRRFVRMCE